jgi:hypothetical protein
MVSPRSGRQFVANRNDKERIMITRPDKPEIRLIPITKWNDFHSCPPGGLRHSRFHAETNGFASAFKRVSRRVLIDEAEFFRCVERQDQGTV